MQWLLVQAWRLVLAAILPRRDVREPVVVAKRFAVRCLVFDAEMAAARFLTLQRVHAHQLGQLEEISDTAGLLELLIELLARAGDEHVAMKLVTEVGNLAQRMLEARARARH